MRGHVSSRVSFPQRASSILRRIDLRPPIVLIPLPDHCHWLLNRGKPCVRIAILEVSPLFVGSDSTVVACCSLSNNSWFACRNIRCADDESGWLRNLAYLDHL